MSGWYYYWWVIRGPHRFTTTGSYPFDTFVPFVELRVWEGLACKWHSLFDDILCAQTIKILHSLIPLVASIVGLRNSAALPHQKK